MVPHHTADIAKVAVSAFPPAVEHPQALAECRP
ncbi:Uncharacterised protein [Mycobacterium tuberculosis]|nr:Uncharacterised protein [Mycobacterium tuberculosis]